MNSLYEILREEEEEVMLTFQGSPIGRNCLADLSNDQRAHAPSMSISPLRRIKRQREPACIAQSLRKRIRHSFVHFIAEGSFGSVSKFIRSEVTNGEIVKGESREVESREVAIKTIALREGKNDMREIEICRLLLQQPHPNIVNIFEVVVGNTSAYVSMDCVELTFLGHIAASGGCLTQQEVEPFLRDLLSGLDYLHARGIVHRDIKPNNLLLLHQQKSAQLEGSDGTSASYRLQICDFGLSTRATPTRSNVSILSYAAPELLLAESYCFPIDLWAAGCVIAEALCGRSLFQGTTEIQRLHSIFRIGGEPLQQFSDLFAVDDDVPLEETSVKKELCNMAEVTSDFADVLTRMLTCDQERRATATQALQLLTRRALL
jgi:serine/threonine protein kinase